MQIVIFELCGEKYAIETSRVQGIDKMMAITKVPCAPRSIKGLINLRGSIISVLDPYVMLGMNDKENRSDTMSGLFGTFNTLRRALGASQYALNTTSHNIANANTEGYSRQRVTMETSLPMGSTSFNSSSGPGQLGTGVEVGAIIRVRNEFLDVQIRNEKSTYGMYTAREHFLTQIETIFMEPSENGLSKAMGDMWNAWQELSRGPENSTMRSGVIDSSIVVADMLRHTYKQLEDLEGYSKDQARRQIYDFNQIIDQIKDLNKQIMGVKISGNNPNDLLDKQDLLIDKLSELASIQISRGPLGEVTIECDGNTILGKNEKVLGFVESREPENPNGKDFTIYYNTGDTNELKALLVKTTDPAYNDLKDADVIWINRDTGAVEGKALVGDETVTGSIKGYVTISNEIDEYKNQLNALAKGLAYAVNTVLNDGEKPYIFVDSSVTTDTITLPDGQKVQRNPDYIAFFVNSENGLDDGTITAKNITINREIITDPSLIKTNGRKSVDPVTGDIEYYPSNNGDRALAVAQLRDTRLFMNEFLENNSVIISGIVNEDGSKKLGISGSLSIRDEVTGNTKVFGITGGQSLDDIALMINSMDPSDPDYVDVQAQVVNGRLLIKSNAAPPSPLTITKDIGGNDVGDLRVFSNNSPILGKITLTSGAAKEIIDISSNDSLQDIANKINGYTTLNVRATVEGGRLIIQSTKLEDNSVTITDDVNGNILKDLKIYQKDDDGENLYINDSMYLRLNNSILSNYNMSTVEIKIKDDPKGTTLQNYFGDTIAKLGSSSKQATGIVTNQEALLAQLDIKKESVSGVSMDEEMANMIQFQRSYQAAARMVSTIDELLDTIINRMLR